MTQPLRNLSSNVTILSRTISSGVDFSDYQLRKDLYDHIKTIVHQLRSDANVTCPPLVVIYYAIRNILEPTLLKNQILDLLTLLAHVNVARKHTISATKNVLNWNTVYKTWPKENVRTLSRADQELLEGFVYESVGLQSTYRDVVHACFKLDIYHTFVSGASNEAWLNLLKIYFPHQFEGFCAQAVKQGAAEISASCLFHYDLSEEEHKSNDDVGMQCALFASNASCYLESPAEYCKQLGVSPESTFEELFPRPSEDALRVLVYLYLAKVEEIVNTLESMFGNNRER
ncbi:uncharacterized protein FIBRA_06807 [Fibroporia radiculosa]|uniref:Uncharacterized protein n=1 Tax=Fibroporia radiculosa TaxID=599839 RepID=J4GCJ9_9APHY|nr:uncharacterized protein FIBRA_06807 [Fibroporia radiculosa]CCM04623.1 predicted protein [Fibroporia radiculosa]